MNSPFIRWWTVFCSFVCLIFLALIPGGGAEFIWLQDATYISWLVLSLFFIGSLHLGYHAKGRSMQFEPTEFFIEICGGLGMLGTIVGLMIAMIGSFNGIDAGNPASIKSALAGIASGTGAALTTTLVGITSSIMLQCQLVAVRGRWRA